jgi:hypothetical protein
MGTDRLRKAAVLVLLLCIDGFVASSGMAQAAQKLLVKSERFDRDPKWEGFNNRMKPEKPTTITQDFGYSATNHAGKRAGEIGGAVHRSMTPAYYAARINPQTLDDKLQASGSFAVTSAGGSGGIFFGWFNPDRAGSSGRPTNSLGMCFDFQESGGRLAVYLITAGNRCHGNFVTPYIPGTYRPTPIKSDGSVRYSWKLSYDPSASGGNGQFRFTIKGDGKSPANFENKALVVDIPAELRKDGVLFTHFGMMNLLVDGGRAAMYFDDLEFNGKSEDFSSDPKWEASGNRGVFTEREPHGIQNFGFSATSNCGSGVGEVGGILWRNDKGGYYADRVGRLSMEDRLEASGRVVFVVGGTDADMRFGWFSSKTNNPAPAPDAPHFLGIKVGGPTRVGHYFLPEVITSQGARYSVESRGGAKLGPIMVPKKVCDWSLVYDPTANGGHGSIHATLDGESVTLLLKPGAKKEGTELDRFGLLAIPVGGHHVKIFLDDVKYTAADQSQSQR